MFLSSPVGRLGVKAGLEDIGDIWITTITVIVVIVYAVALRMTNAILPLPVVARPQSEAIASIMARPWVIALRVTLAVPDLTDSTVAEDKTMSKAGVFDSVDAEIKGDVVRSEGLIQGLMLGLNLGRRHGGVSPIIIREIYNTVPNSLGRTEVPVVVVAIDDVRVVAWGQTTGRRQKRRYKFLIRNRSGDDDWVKANFIRSPQPSHLKDTSSISVHLYTILFQFQCV